MFTDAHLDFYGKCPQTEIYFWVDEKGIKHYEAGSSSKVEFEREQPSLRSTANDLYFVEVMIAMKAVIIVMQ